MGTVTQLGGRSDRQRYALWGAGVVLVLALIIGAWQCDERQIAHLDPVARRALFDRTMANVATCTTEEAVRTSEFCAEQARFARLFPECDADCQLRTKQWLSAHR